MLAAMMRAAESEMAISADPGDIDVFLNIPSWAVHSTYHTILKATPGAAILVGIYCSISTSLLSGKQLEIMQRQTDHNTTCTKTRVKCDHKLATEYCYGIRVSTATKRQVSQRSLDYYTSSNE